MIIDYNTMVKIRCEVAMAEILKDLGLLCFTKL